MAKQLLGKEVTAALNERIKGNVAALQEKGVNPTLCIIRVGENPSDISYEKGATKRCETLGVACEKILLPEDVAQDELLAVIDKVNKDDHIHGVLLFRPLPKHLDQAVIEYDRSFHVRCFHRQEDRFPTMYTTGMYGDPGSLWNRLHRQESSCNRKKPCCWQTGSHDAC